MFNVKCEFILPISPVNSESLQQVPFQLSAMQSFFDFLMLQFFLLHEINWNDEVQKPPLKSIFKQIAILLFAVPQKLLLNT